MKEKKNKKGDPVRIHYINYPVMRTICGKGIVEGMLFISCPDPRDYLREAGKSPLCTLCVRYLKARLRV